MLPQNPIVIFGVASDWVEKAEQVEWVEDLIEHVMDVVAVLLVEAVLAEGQMEDSQLVHAGSVMFEEVSLAVASDSL